MLRKTSIHIITILMLFSAILPGQGVAELHKLPLLIEHYHHHQHEHEGEELSFASFLWMHYGDSSSHKTEENHDDLLLFSHCCSAQFFIAEEAYVFSVSTKTKDATHAQELKETYFHQPFSSIFQPPRFS